MGVTWWIGVLCLMVSAKVSHGAHAPTAAVAGQSFRVTTAAGSAINPFLISLDWTKPQPQITRALIVIHGKGRDIKADYRTALEAAGGGTPVASETIFIAPQFLDEDDVVAHGTSGEVLRWRGTAWDSGTPAYEPVAISAYEVVDALIARLADRSMFPNLTNVVLAGHSAGAQLVQRYAVVGRAPVALSRTSGLHFRFVIANASSYVYFSAARPAPRSDCKALNRWKYGIVDGPPYLKSDAENGWSELEANYAQQDVIYLLGTADTDPHEKDLDVSCSGEAQGPTRFARGQAYYAYLQSRNGFRWNQRMWFVPGVAHSVRQMFTSPCGMAALFDIGSCPDR
jgi:hypothetical protein